MEDLGEEINKEDVVVAYSHAVIDPWTMMIVSLHAPLAYDAVSAPPSPNYPALRAQTLRIKCLEQTQKLHAFGIYVPWISWAQADVQENSQKIEYKWYNDEDWIEATE